MENTVLGASFNNQLPDEKVAKLLPALSLLAEDVGERISLDSNSLREILVSVGADQEEWAYEELKLWLKSLDKARDNSNNAQKDAAIIELRNRGIPEFPAKLAVYVVTNHQTSPAQINTESSPNINRKGHPDKPSEPFHRLLPDHGWHNDITWEQLPNWIKTNPKLIVRLNRGEQVIGRNVRYRFVANKLIRRLRYRVPVASDYKGRRKYRR